MATDDQLLDGLAARPEAQPDPSRASLVGAGDAPGIDAGALLFLLARRVGQLRDFLATAHQAIRDIRAKDAQQDTRLTAIEDRLTKGGL